MLLQHHRDFAVGETCVVFVWIVGIDLLFAANTQTKLQNILVYNTKFIFLKSKMYLSQKYNILVQRVFVRIVGSDLLFARNTQTKLKSVWIYLSQDESMSKILITFGSTYQRII